MCTHNFQYQQLVNFKVTCVYAWPSCDLPLFGIWKGS